ncbi:MAG: hypothetical protein GEU71_05205 [Actinobacteria bacterium]|nr:hypothetical protein [Actinomycetota bacterium]
MERVAFLIEETGQRLAALLNPESLVMRRRSGVRPRSSATGRLTSARLMDDPLLYTGGGETELELDLLFDTFLVEPPVTTDVRDLTRPLWQLAENAGIREGYGRPPLVRFLWGKVWNLPGIVQAVAERLEQFDQSGTPRRSWLRMRLLRSAEPPPSTVSPPAEDGLLLLPEGAELAPDNVVVHEVIGAGPDAPGERLEVIAERYYGNAALWRAIAAFNGISDPLDVPAGTLLRIPPLSVFTRSS